MADIISKAAERRLNPSEGAFNPYAAECKASDWPYSILISL